MPNFSLSSFKMQKYEYKRATRVTNIKMCNVLHITPWFPPHKGGIANHVSTLCTQLRNIGCNVSVITVKKIAEKHHPLNTESNSVDRVSCIYLPGWPYPTLKSVSIPCDAGSKINSTIKRGNFDIVHAHGIHYPICWIAMYLSRKYNIHSVLSLHGSYALNPNVLGGETRLESWLYRNLFSRVLSHADAVTAPTQSIMAMAQRYLKPSSKTSLYTIEYGIDTWKFIANLDKKTEYRRKYNIRERAIVLLFSGRFEKVKGILEFSEAAKKIVTENKTVEVIIIGEGHLRSQIHSILQGVSGIHLFDWQPQEKVHEFYIASDIFVIPSRFEGLPLTILEAMNAGLHLVYASVGGIPDIVKGYGLKTTLKEISSKELYNVLMKLLHEKLITNEKQAALRYAQLFDWKHVSSKVKTLYEDLIIRD